MVTVLKDVPIPGLEVIPCRLNGPRGVVKAFLVHDPAGMVLVDTGRSDEDAEIILERIASIGRSPDDIAACVITHHHTDHLGGLAKLRSIANFPVFCHPADGPHVESKTGVSVDRGITDLELIDGLEVPLRVVHMPGHTPGSVAVFSESHHAVMAGDAIVSAGEHLMVSPPFLCEDPEEARASVRRLIELDLGIESVLVAHGEDVYSSADLPLARILKERRDF